MAMEYVTGEEGAIETGESVVKADAHKTVVIIEGPYSALKDLVPAKGATATSCEYVPSGMVVELATLSTDGEGAARIEVHCVYLGADGGLTAVPDRITYTISMGEVVTKLEAHPYFGPDNRKEIALWLATEPDERYDSSAQGAEYKFRNKDGNLTQVSVSTEKYCKAYMEGIETYMRYYPIIDKISYWKRPPGFSITGFSVTGGSPRFSNDVGKWASPGISLNGYDSTGWFKSGDNWQQKSDHCWTRREQWTYTPYGSGSDHSWIYQTAQT